MDGLPEPLDLSSLMNGAPQPQAQKPGFDKSKLMRLIPLVAAAAKGGPGALEGLLHGYQQAEAQKTQQATQQQQTQRQGMLDATNLQGQQFNQQMQVHNAQQAQRQAQAALESQFEATLAAEGLDSPEALDLVVQRFEAQGRAVGATPGTFRDRASQAIPATTLQRRAAEKKVNALKAQFGVDKWMQEGAKFRHRLSGGREVSFNELLAMAGMTVDPTAPPMPSSDKRGFAPKDITLNGKRMTANFDPDTGNYYAIGETKTPLAGEILEYQKPSASVTIASGAGSDAEAIADAIIRGEQPPETTGLYRLAPAVRTALARKGYNMATAQTDWRATQRHFTTLNGPQQTRMRQAVDNAAHSLDVIESLAEQWRGGRFPTLNKGRLAAARQGALGPEAQKIATALEAQIADVTSELANVYMGGNSPTDHALSLASKNLAANWSEGQLKALIEQSRTNLQIRLNSISNVGVAGASQNNVYAPTAPAVDPSANPFRKKP
jgi:hypothetical protein